MISDELIDLLLKHRTNDVRVATSAENGDANVISVTDVRYDSGLDCILIDTEEIMSPVVTFMLDGSVYIEDEPVGDLSDVRSLLTALVEALGGTVAP